MTITIIYRKDSEMYRPVSEFIELMRRKYPDKEVTELELDTREGAEMAEMYSMTDYPGIIVKTDAGAVVNTWVGLPLPLVDEVVSSTLS